MIQRFEEWLKARKRPSRPAAGAVPAVRRRGGSFFSWKGHIEDVAAVG